MESSKGPRPNGRALVSGIWMWDLEENGFITVPYIIDEASFSNQPGFPDQIRANLADMEKDLGCIKLKEVRHNGNNGYNEERVRETKIRSDF